MADISKLAGPAHHRRRATLALENNSPRLARRAWLQGKLLADARGSAENLMMKKRRRFKQTHTLAERLAEHVGRLRERASSSPSGTEQARLWQKVHQAESALRIDAWLAAPGAAPRDATTPIDRNRRKRSVCRPTDRADT